ncbi:MAG: hypothetical protein A3F13_01035 [Gammaproteobacteria bacterium RIFCSPHIGHO2_12_FULL_40_19]|nr:MAG: hypothetical protein A3F13_01035 [Gammaproteobacteria bacterium RIFCSPHIGHO2_12_FULL_40_19]
MTTLRRSIRVSQALSLVLPSLLMKYGAERSVLNAKRSARDSKRAVCIERCVLSSILSSKLLQRITL